MSLTPEQKQARIGKMTSSVVCAALGLHDKASEIDAWMSVLGEKEWDDGNKATERGNRLEDPVLAYPADRLGLSWERAPFRAHPTIPWAADSADALYWKDGADHLEAIGEGKTVGLGMAGAYGEDELTDDVSRPTLIQAHWHLIHWPEVNQCFVPVLFGGYAFEFKLYRILRDANFEGELLEQVSRWHRDYIVTRKPPPVSEKDTDFLKAKHPTATAKKMLADTAEIEQWARAKVTAQKNVKEFKAAEELAKNKLRELLGDAEGVKAGWGTIWWRNSEGSITIDLPSAVRELRESKKMSEDDYAKLRAKVTTVKTVEEVDYRGLFYLLGGTPEDERRHTIGKPGPRKLTVNVKDMKNPPAAKTAEEN